MSKYTVIIDIDFDYDIIVVTHKAIQENLSQLFDIPIEDVKITEMYRATENVWGENANYPRDQWRNEVIARDTNLGYWDWVAHQVEAKESENQNESKN